MESKIRVEHDFGTGQTWLQMYVSATASNGGQPDLRDLALKTFIEKASDPKCELCLIYPESNQDNSVAQIMIRSKAGFKIWENSTALREWLEEQGVDFEKTEGSFVLTEGADLFMLGESYGRWQQKQLNTNWVGCNATYLCENDPGGVYEKGKSYNLEIATGPNHTIKVKHHVTAIVQTYAQDKTYKDLATFLTAWDVSKK